jgi:hypothetical protein
MRQLTIVAHIHAKPDHIAQVQAELRSFRPPASPVACSTICTATNDPAHFMFYEN